VFFDAYSQATITAILRLVSVSIGLVRVSFEVFEVKVRVLRVSKG